jgi:hypothetical protein
MTKPTAPDLLDLAEAVAAGKLGAADAERRVRAALGPDRTEAAETAVRDLRRLVVAARAVRAHAFATREAFGDQGTELAHASGSIATIPVGPVRAGSVRRGSSRGGGRASQRTWLLVAATLLIGTGVVGASIVGGRLATPNPSPTTHSTVVDASATPEPGPSSPAVPPKAPSWSVTGSMSVPGGATATRLLDGRVLVAGGGRNDASAELYDPATGTWTGTGNMITGRHQFTATLLADGKVLVAGGQALGGKDPMLASAELYDPASGAWTATGSMTQPRGGHRAALLPDGKVLVAGGYSGVNQPTWPGSAELYDPGTGAWTPAETLSPELHDPSGNWTGTAWMALTSRSATLLPDGKVLEAGGASDSFVPARGVYHDQMTIIDWSLAELYDPASGTSTATGSMTTQRVGPTATLLLDGKVLVAGGARGPAVQASAELYDPASGTWTATVSMLEARGAITATLLLDGRVLVMNGPDPNDTAGVLPNVFELYDPGRP